MDNITIFIRQYVIPPIEILIIAFVLYYIYKTLVRTRAIQMLKGVFVLVITYFIAYVLRMEIILYIIQGGIQIFAITLVVLFSPEIRKLFSELGTNGIFSKVMSEKNPKVIEIITDTVKDLAETKTGALIVFERTIGLRNYIEATGVMLDCLIKKELLMTIFFKNTPLHDGAVICKNDRIMAASVVVPPSTKTGSKKRGVDQKTPFGLRHRAGIGITEESDAVAIIVSEETGKISIAEGGRIHYHIGLDEFRSKLYEYLLGESETESKKSMTRKFGKLSQFFRSKFLLGTDYNQILKYDKKELEDKSKKNNKITKTPESTSTTMLDNQS